MSGGSCVGARNAVRRRLSAGGKRIRTLGPQERLRLSRPAAELPRRFAVDAPVEEAGFEPSVPLPRLSSIRTVRAEIIGRSADVFRRDREFDVSALQGRLSTSSQSQRSTDPGLIAGTWHRLLFLTRDRWFESGSLHRRVGLIWPPMQSGMPATLRADPRSHVAPLSASNRRDRRT